MVNIERGFAASECKAVQTEVVDVGWEGKVEEGGKETCDLEGVFNKNTVKTPLITIIIDITLLQPVKKI